MRYVLGELTEEECDALEEAYFGTTDGFEELQAVEQELMDAYVAGELSPERRLRFESRLVPGEHGNVQFARALRAALPDRQPSVARAEARGRRRLVPWWTAVAATLSMAAVGWLALRAPRPEVPSETSPPVSPRPGAQPTAMGPSPTAPGRGERRIALHLVRHADRGRPETTGPEAHRRPAEADRVVFTLVVGRERGISAAQNAGPARVSSRTRRRAGRGRASSMCSRRTVSFNSKRWRRGRAEPRRIRVPRDPP